VFGREDEGGSKSLSELHQVPGSGKWVDLPGDNSHEGAAKLNFKEAISYSFVFLSLLVDS